MNTFLTSDTHFGHRLMCKVDESTGCTYRPWDTIEEMNEALVDNWNSIVRPKDTIYHLGDVVINRSVLPILSRLNGKKILIKGNHDVFRAEEYLQYFTDLRGSATLDGMICTHIPIHPNSLERWGKNIHGHLHTHNVMREDWYNGIYPDPRYLCVSVEQTDYTPISLEDCKKRFEEMNR